MPAAPGQTCLLLPLVAKGYWKKLFMESCEGQEKEAEQKHRGGRPTKNVKRSNHLMVRLTPTERFLIEGKAKEANMNQVNGSGRLPKGQR
jgi:hypothetical protein